MKRFMALFVALSLALVSSTALAQFPKLTAASPLGIAPGQTVDLTLSGTALAKPTGVWSNLSAKFELPTDDKKNGTAADKVVYRITVPADAPQGTYALRIATPGGISNLRLFTVDELPTLRQAANTTLATAQELQLPVAVEGSVNAESFHYFKFRGEAGQRLSLDVQARRLGSALDSVVRLLDATGRELAFSDDENATEADSRFAIRLPAAGEYFIELRDIRYQGSANHVFRMRVGDFPLVTTTYPLGVQRGTTARLSVTGPDSGEVPMLEVAAPADTSDSASFVAKHLNGKHGTGGRVVVSGGIEQVEFEPNDTVETATLVSLSGAINGRFEAPKDRDQYRFAVKKGERYRFVGRTRTLGAPTDLLLRLLDPAGKQLAESDDTGLDEGSIELNAPADGVYQLVVEELLGRGGSEQVYRVEIEPYRPSFSLSVDADVKAKIEADPFNAPRGGTFVAKVSAVRRDYTGPITLSVEGLGEGVKFRTNIIAEGKNDTTMQVTLPPSLESGKYYPLRIVGRAKIGDADVAVTASGMNAVRGQLGGLIYPPAWLDSQMMLGIGGEFADFLKLSTEPKTASIAQLLGTTNLKLKVEKLSKFDDKIDVAVEGLPSGFTSKVAAIEKGKTEAVIELTGPANVSPGKHTLHIAATGTLQNQTKTVRLDVPLEIVEPLAVEATIVDGATAERGKLKVKVIRAPGVTGEVALAVRGAHRGLKADTVKLAADKNEAELNYSADKASVPGELIVSGTVSVNKQNVRIDSRPVKVQVAKRN